MQTRSEQTHWKATIVACCAALGLMILPANLQSLMRATAQDLLQPGHVALKPLIAWFQTESINTESDTEDPRLRQQINALENAVRRQDVMLADMRRKLSRTKRYGALPFKPTDSEPLIQRNLIAAQVLGRERDLVNHPGLLIGLGSSSGVTTDAFVVRTDAPIIDAGQREGMRTGFPVYCGQCVVGRIERAGQSTSSVQLITDPQYSGRAQLLRRAGETVHFGAEGILKGNGDGTCRLTGISYTEAVGVGDAVYTGGQLATFPLPMYYGKIVKAELKSGARWEIVVQPQIAPNDLRDVAVLRESVNSVRVLGQ